jgi:peptidyl-prolyl cis-trans isomerase C
MTRIKTALMVPATALLIAAGPGRFALAAPDTTTPPATPTRTLEEIRNEVLVSVNGTPITGELFGLYFQARQQKTPGAQSTPQSQNQAINELVNILLLAQDATRQSLDQRRDVVLALELQRSEALSRLALQEFVRANPIDEATVRKTYDERFSTPTKEYKAHHILLKTRDEAGKIIAELAGGGEFAALAKAHSIDPGGKNGGDLGWFEGSQMVKPFADAVAAMAKGETSSQPVQTPFGWHVIRLEDSREKAPPAFDAVRDQLTGELQRTALADYVAKLRDAAKIDVNERLSSRTPAPQTK